MAKLRLKQFEKSPEADDASYEQDLQALQQQLEKVQTAYITHGHRAVIVFEGWDASGKGGTIKRFIEPLDTRFCHVWPISAPDDQERNEHYLARFWRRLPQKRQLAVFDRSWYGRVLVERVEGYASKATWKRAYDEINAFEDMLIDDGIRVIKLFMHITPEEQKKRLIERATVPWKRWKTGLDDYRNRSKTADYVTAIHDMFDHCNPKQAPWHVIDGNDKKHARLSAIETIVKRLEKGLDISDPPLDPALRETAQKALGIRFSADGTKAVHVAASKQTVAAKKATKLRK
jgi:AMP-polyphosphate phosphotransferase